MNLSHLLFASSLVVSAPVSAALYDWNGSDSLITTDSSNNDIGTGSTPWRNILKLWFAQDDTTAYFRMDLEGGPGSDQSPLDPLLYGIYINADGDPATGASGSQSDYLYWVESANEVVGVDSLIDFHFDGTGAPVLAHAHFYDPAEAISETGGLDHRFGQAPQDAERAPLLPRKRDCESIRCSCC
jgi:hypothetical protein